jgi:hypothetical protein
MHTYTEATVDEDVSAIVATELAPLNVLESAQD